MPAVLSRSTSSRVSKVIVAIVNPYFNLATSVQPNADLPE